VDNSEKFWADYVHISAARISLRDAENDWMQWVTWSNRQVKMKLLPYESSRNKLESKPRFAVLMFRDQLWGQATLWRFD
jgi:hypothetical protein